jgi:hypothetical protein
MMRVMDSSRVMQRAAVVVAALLLICISVRSVAAWKYWGDLDHNSPGTWLCMAMDAADGVLYRPMHSDLGYGGTRYAPLFPVMIAAFVKAGAGAVEGGFAAGVVATAITLGGFFVLSRRLGTSAALAGAMAVFLLAATCTRTIVLGIKGDLLPVGLALCGLAAVVRASERAKPNAGLAAGAVCFALALAAKVTSIFGIGAAVIWLAFRGKFRQAVVLGIAWVIAVIAVVVLTQLASEGRAAGIFLACGSGGGSLARMLKGPHLLAGDLLHQDRVLLVIWVLALLTIALTWAWKTLPAIFFLICTAGTVAIYGSPGTHLNHLVDMNAAAMLVISTAAWNSRTLRIPVMLITLLVMCFAAAACWRQANEIRRNDERGQMEMAIADTQRFYVNGPILSEDPLLPMLDGKRPYMLDPFMFRAVRKRDPDFAGEFWANLDQKRFKAVILHGPPDDPAYSTDEYDFGPGFIDRLEQGYVLTSVHGTFYVLLPKR